MRVGLVVVGVAVLTACAAPAEEVRPRTVQLSTPGRTPLTKRTLTLPAHPHTRMVVKFVDALQVRTTSAGRLRSDSGGGLDAVDRVRRSHGLGFTPLFGLPRDRIADLTARAHARSGRVQPDLLGMFVVTSSSTDPAARLGAAEDLQALDEVEFVTFESLFVPPPIDVAPTTPDFVANQGYLGPAPGIGAQAAWALGYDGSGIRITDIEYLWRLAHEEWNEGQLIPEAGQTPDEAAIAGITSDDHGTAVAGEIKGGNNGYGVTGSAWACDLALYSELTIEGGSRRAEAILSAAEDGVAGDIIQLEMQTTDGLSGDLGPAELEESVWMATQVATDAGMVVIGAAGNGNLDLDDESLAYYHSRGDSGAIIVGAGEPQSHTKLSFSTYGSRVNVQGWGVGVFTAGYGDFLLAGDDFDQSYTASFSGTSSATPIVGGAAALVQQAVMQANGVPLTSRQMRAVLRETGVPQGGGGHIGPLPQVPAAIVMGLSPPTEPPQVQITSPAPTQTEDDLLDTAIEIAADPDTVQVQVAINGEVQAVVDDIAPYAFETVSFPPGTWEIVAIATNVWGVEGESEPVVLEVGYEPAPEPEPTDSSTSGAVDPTTDGSTSDAMPAPGPPSLDDDDSSSTGEPPASTSDDADGCGCSTAPRPGTLAWGLLVLAVARRRRSPRGVGFCAGVV